MVKKITRIITQNQLLSGSFVLFVGMTASNFGNYLYHLFMGRLLGPSDYGTLVSLMSLTYVVSFASLTLNTTSAKFISQFKARGDLPGAYSFLRGLSEKMFFFGLLVFCLFALNSKFIANFLQIESGSWLVILLSFTFLTRFLNPINNGALQGFLKFSFLSFNNFLAVIFKVGLGIFLVLMGFSLNGVLIAIVLAEIIPYFVSFLPLRFLWGYKLKAIKVDWRETWQYAAPTLVAILSLSSLYTSDILLVKHFFSPHEAGLYSALSVMGKIVFFASSTIITVMFPLVVQNYEKKNILYRKILFQAFGLVALSSAGVTLIYFLFPKLMVSLLYGASYLQIASHLWLFGIFISLYSLINVLVNFFLCVRRLRVAFFAFGAALSQIVLIWFFHDSIFEVIKISIVVSALLLFLLLIYYFKSEKE